MMMKDKRGGIIVLVIFIIILFLILFAGFIMLVGSTILNYVFDIAAPELTNLGQVGDANMTQVAGSTITPLNNMVQSLTFMTGVLYVMMLIGSVGFAFAFRSTQNKWLIGFYFMLVIMLILGSIFISNMYEEFATGNNELANRFREHTILSFMILDAPAIFTIIAFLTGIILFAGPTEEYV